MQRTDRERRAARKRAAQSDADGDEPPIRVSHCEEMLATCAPLTVLAEHVRTFAKLLTTRRAADLEDG